MTVRTEKALLVINVKLSSRSRRAQKGRVVITPSNLTELEHVCQRFCETHGLPLRTAGPIVLTNVREAVNRFLAKNPKVLEVSGPVDTQQPQKKVEPLRLLQPFSPPTAHIGCLKRKNEIVGNKGNPQVRSTVERKQDKEEAGDWDKVLGERSLHRRKEDQRGLSVDQDDEEVENERDCIAGRACFRGEEDHSRGAWGKGPARRSREAGFVVGESEWNRPNAGGWDDSTEGKRVPDSTGRSSCLDTAGSSSQRGPSSCLHAPSRSTQCAFTSDERGGSDVSTSEASRLDELSLQDSPLLTAPRSAFAVSSPRFATSPNSEDGTDAGNDESGSKDVEVVKACGSTTEETEVASSEELYAQLFRKYSMQPDVTVPTSNRLQAHSAGQLTPKSERVLAYVRLHEAAAQREKDREAARRLRLAQQERNDLAECTFRPNVNRGYHREEPNPVEERLLAKGRLRQKRLVSSIERRLMEEMQECSFKPEISAHARSLSTSISTLYEDAIRRQKSREGDAGRWSHNVSVRTSKERSRMYERLAKQKIGNFRYTEEKDKCTFQPQIGRGPLRNRRGAGSDSVHISSVLYACRNEAEELKQFLQKQQIEQERTARERRRPRHWR